MQIQPILGYFWAIFGLYGFALYKNRYIYISHPPPPPLLDLGPLFTYPGSAPVVSYTLMSDFGQRRGLSSTTTDHRAYIGLGIYGHWPLIPWFTTSWLPRYVKLYLFWISSMIQLIWAHSHWNRTNLEIWPLYKRSITFCYFDFYLENEALYKFHVTEFVAPYDPRKNLTCITT